MSHEYSDIPKMRASTELPVDGTQQPELAPGGVHHTIGTVATGEAGGTASTHYIQDPLDVGLDSPLFPAPQTERKSSQPDNSSVAEHHPVDMRQEI